MNNMNIDQVLAQMRTLATQVSRSPTATEQTADVSFGDVLKQTVDKVNATQVHAGEMKKAFELGTEDLNLAEVMIAVQKSNVSFEAMVQVRNKLVDAYKEVMNMPI